jgi:hypothetical protein
MTRRAVPRWMTSDGEAIFGVEVEDAEGVLTACRSRPARMRGGCG